MLSIFTKLSHILAIFAVIHGSSLANNHGVIDMPTEMNTTNPAKVIENYNTVYSFLASNIKFKEVKKEYEVNRKGFEELSKAPSLRPGERDMAEIKRDEIDDEIRDLDKRIVPVKDQLWQWDAKDFSTLKQKRSDIYNSLIYLRDSCYSPNPAIAKEAKTGLLRLGAGGKDQKLMSDRFSNFLLNLQAFE